MSNVYKDQRGYLRYKSTNRLVHREVMRNHLGRRLTAKEVVHHKDEDKLHNHISNLRLFKSQFWHNLHHKFKWNVTDPVVDFVFRLLKVTFIATSAVAVFYLLLKFS
jgi:hypothetical protein